MIQQLLQNCLSKLKILCGEDRQQGLVLAQATRIAWTQCVSDVLLSQVQVLLKSAQMYYRNTSKDIDGVIVWTFGEIYELDNDNKTVMIRAQAKISDPVTNKQTHDFVIAIELVDALTDDFQLILNKLNMQSAIIHQDDDKKDSKVTIH